MELSVVILNYKVPHYLMLCLDSVSKAIKNMKAEIIVIDNNSEDESLALTNQYYPEVKTIANKENSGFSKANNLAVKQAKGEYLCVLNPDTVVTEDCFEKLLKLHQHKEKLGAIGTQLIDGKGYFLPESKRNIPNPKVAFQKLMGQDKDYYNNNLQTHENGKTDVLVGAFMFLKRQDYLTVKGFDEDFFMYGEDIDLSYKLLKNKLNNYYAGDIKTIHFKGESTVKNKQYYDRFFGAMLIFYKKHYNNKLLEYSLKFALGFLKSTASQKKKNQTTETYHEAIIITDQQNNFKGLEKKFNKVYFYTKREISTINLSTLRKKYIIFDMSTMRYMEVIEKIVNWRDIPAKIRIRPEGINFCVGSDSKDEQGEMLSLDL
ncbi:MAG: glycosyltransferase family 2 protein [Psychroflexus halocasei]